MNTTALDRVLFSIDYFFYAMWKLMGLSVSSHCDLETSDDDRTLVFKDGSLVSVLRIHGNRNMIGKESRELLNERIGSKLAAYLGMEGRGLQVIYEYDPERADADINRFVQRGLDSCQRLGISPLSDVVQEWGDALKTYCAAERIYLAPITRLSSLSPREVKAERKQIAKAIADTPQGLESQNLAVVAKVLRDDHRAFVDTIRDDLQTTGISSEILEVHQILQNVRSMIDPEYGDEWRPLLPGDPLSGRLPALEAEADDSSCLLFPRIENQLFRNGMSIENFHVVRVGERYHAPLVINLLPAPIETFEQLFLRLRRSRTPWRVAFHIDPEGLNGHWLKRVLATLTGWTSAQSRQIQKSFEYLRTLRYDSGDPILALRLVATTWGRNLEELRRNHSYLVRALEGWGNPGILELTGRNPANLYTVTLPAVRQAADGVPPLPAHPIRVAKMLPLAQPASPWTDGSILFRTPQGIPFPYEPYSSLQLAWVTLIYAPMGSGKSVLMNTLNFGLCLAPGSKTLPKIGIIDIGPSSSGLISLLQESLPPAQRHLAQHIRIRMTRDYCINPCDTFLGCRYPLAFQHAFLINLLVLLATPPGRDQPYDSIPGIAQMVVDMAYRHLDQEEPNLYENGRDLSVDKRLEELDFQTDANTSWWEVSDFLFDNGFEHEALLAQRFAVPTLPQIAAFARSEEVRNSYKGKVPTGESVTDYFWRAISESCRLYPILAESTRFSLGDARVVAIDLDEVAPKSGTHADRQREIMYMFARKMVADDFFLGQDHLSEIPDKYREYHRQRFLELEMVPKRLCFDEFHRTRGQHSQGSFIRAQIMQDIREGRKWGVEIMLCSQRLEDFDEDMIDLATTCFILGAGGKSIDSTLKTFKLPEDARTILMNLGKPSKAGSNMIGYFVTSRGRFTHAITNTLSAVMLWAFSTSRRDTSLRNLLYQKLEPPLARLALAKRFPAGTAEPEIERRQKLLRERNIMVKDTSIIEELAEEILALAEKLRLEG